MVDQPDGNVPAAGSEESAGGDHAESAAIDRGMLQATRRQAWGTVLGAFAGVSALIVTVFALVISAAAWNGQRELNRQQAQLNAYAQESQQEVYSSRVAMWAAVGTTSSSVLPQGLDVWIQNRAPIPIHQVRVIATLTSNVSAESTLGDIPPCTTETLRIAPPVGESFIKNPQEWLGYTELRLAFVETSRSWLLSSDSLAMLPATRSVKPSLGLRQAAASQRPLDGCGP